MPGLEYATVTVADTRRVSADAKKKKPKPAAS